MKRRNTILRRAALAILVVIAPVTSHAASSRPFYSNGDGASASVRAALRTCEEPVASPGDLTRGLERARRLAAQKPSDARGHFAVFCNLARLVEQEGPSLDALPKIDRARDSLDRALELQPNYIDAIVAKGALLIELPWLLGGDEDEGERLLRRALRLDADFEPARARLEALDPDDSL